MFNHVNIDLPSLNKETIDGVRYYDVPGNAKLVSITSITSWINREIFREWRARVGNEQADKVTKAATSRGTDMHTLTEYYLKNENLPEVQPLSEFLFKQSKPKLELLIVLLSIMVNLPLLTLNLLRNQNHASGLIITLFSVLHMLVCCMS